MIETSARTVYFGTDGIRARVGVEPFTAASLEKLGQAIAEWMCERYGKNPVVLLAHDTRISCSFVKAALKSGLLQFPVSIVDAHILPTAAVVQRLAYEQKFDSGIIISASHNPYYDNGIKIVDRSLGKITEQDEARISYFFTHSARSENYTSLGTDTVCFELQDRYERTVQSFFAPSFLQGKKIVLDCAHGAAYEVAPKIFQQLGATVIALNDQPNGSNINQQCGALHPEQVQQAVIYHQADIGFSFDGDADRVIAVNHSGHIKDGDDILALLLNHPRYQQEAAVVGTIMSNQAFECYVNQYNKKLLRAQVGDKYVSQIMTARNLLLGGEPSGHIIARDYLATGDGIFIALLVCETMQYLNSWSMATFTKFPQILLNVTIQRRRDLQDPALEQIIALHRNLLHNGRLIVRYSGTELLLRIMVEDASYEHARTIGINLSHKLKEFLT